MDPLSEQFLDIMLPLVEGRGEPIQSFFDEQEVVDLVERCGLEVVDHPTHAELHERYLAGRPDGLRAYQVERMLTAAVPARSGVVARDSSAQGGSRRLGSR